MMSHIKNYDVRLVLMVSTLAGTAGLSASLVCVRPSSCGAVDAKAGNHDRAFFTEGLLFSVGAFIFGPLVRMALSRRRESLGDEVGKERQWSSNCCGQFCG
jgi:Zn-dependent protease with chaperone function